jgi:hypothetical protein
VRTQGTSTSASATVTQQQITESHPSRETSPSTTTRAADTDVVQEVADLNNLISSTCAENHQNAEERRKI